MINACRNYYRGNGNELELIDEFEKCYSSEQCIRWYTRETFVYKMVNKALRTEDVQQLHTFRFFIADLSSALACEHKKNMAEFANGTITTVYRGVRLTLTELEQFRSNEGKLISTNGYLSTSRLRRIAVMYAVNDIKRTDSVPVLFEIECHGEENDCSIFADVAKFSDFAHEEEVLFDLCAVFKVKTVSKEDDMWTIRLSATGEGRDIARQYIEEMKKEMQADHAPVLFGSLLIQMGHYQRAQTYFRQLLRDPENVNLAHIHNQLGLVCQFKAEFDQAMSHFDIAYRLMSESHPPLLRHSAHVLCNMSHVLMELGHYEKAFDHCSKAKQVLEKLNNSCHLEMARCLHSIGSSYRGQRKYVEALAYYEQSLSIKRAYLPEIHVHIAETLNSMGRVYLLTKDIEKALNFYLSSLGMYKTCLPENHSDIAHVLHNIADCYYSKRQFDRALQHYHLALAMKEKCFPPGHPSVATTLNNISTILSVQGEKVKALELCLKALRIRERILPFNHPDLIISLISAGHKYEAIEENQHALEHFEKALESGVIFLSQDDPIRKRTERDVRRLKWKVTLKEN